MGSLGQRRALHRYRLVMVEGKGAQELAAMQEFGDYVVVIKDDHLPLMYVIR